MDLTVYPEFPPSKGLRKAQTLEVPSVYPQGIALSRPQLPAICTSPVNQEGLWRWRGGRGVRAPLYDHEESSSKLSPLRP
jgi:hypothetical protein